MGSNHMHNLFRNTFIGDTKPTINEETGEINLSGDTRPQNQDIWLDNKEDK
jgi:hypothetical protein